MRKSHKQDAKTYQKGINSDQNKEFLGGSDKGEHVDALNMRSVSMDGDNFAKKKIKGESSVYPLIDNRCLTVPAITLDDSYDCMMTQEINGYIVEIWASKTPTINNKYPFMRVNGKIVLYSENFPIDVEHPLQYDKNENCPGGEMYITNNNTPPMVFSLKDIMLNGGLDYGSETAACTPKYFLDFNIENFTVPPSAILYKPAFVAQVTGTTGYDFVAGTLGLCVGSYSYSYRLVDEAGERTGFSPITELIPVVRNNSNQFQPQFPHSRTFSSASDVTSPTIYGNHLKIRYDNPNGFTFLELRRDSWNSGGVIGAPPVSEIIASIPIGDNMSVIDVLDRAEANFSGSEILDLEEQTNTYSSIKRAKSIRYFNERLYLMNIGYDSKNIENDVTFYGGTNFVFPTIENMGRPGHKHVYNSAMFKSNMRGEKTGFGVVLFDSDNNASFVKQITGAENFEFPNRRDETSTDTNNTSYKGVVRCANSGTDTGSGPGVPGTTGEVSYTHEVFDVANAVPKEPYPTSDRLFNYNDAGTGSTDPQESFHPVSQNDTTNRIKYLTTSKADITTTTGNPSSLAFDYSPPGFGLDYFSQGIAFKGLDTYPSSSEGFSVVQTEPAQRVVAQGLGMYSLYPSEGAFEPNTSKEANEMWAYFPDLELLYPDIATDILNGNFTSYKLQLVSPLGYFTEPFHWRKPEALNRRRGVDMITYARVLRDKYKDATTPDGEQMNPGISGQTGITDPSFPLDYYRYPAYGKFTNTTGTSQFPSNGNGNIEFDITNIQETTTNSTRQSYFKITTQQDIYAHENQNLAGGANSAAPGPTNWREPFYVINIVRDVDINEGNTTQYKYGSNYIKFKSLVLESSGANNQSAELVSERWEDCIPKLSAGDFGNVYGQLKRFVFTEDEDGNEKRWMNVQFESPATITTILTNLNAAGGAGWSDPTITDGFTIYGIYTSTETGGDSDGVCRLFELNFTETVGYTNYTVPAAGIKVYVKYDKRIPVRVFGGDTYINESTWAAIDNVYDKNGDPSDNDGGWLFSNNEFRMDCSWPLRSYGCEDSWPIWEKAQSIPNFEEGSNANVLEFSQGASAGNFSALIRQLVMMWTAESRYNLSFAFNIENPDKAVSDQYYPLINYIPRPYKWDAGNESDRTQFESDNSLREQYFNDFGFEWNLWTLGGIRFQMGETNTNLDYSKSQTTAIYTTIPTVGFEEQNEFCTRIIWSLRRPINIQNAPGVRTFPANNYFDISDNTGEIKFAWSALSNDKGNNLYAFTNNGVCLLLVDKRVIHEINANELATVGSDIGGILNQLWIDQTIGMEDETWRSWAEYSNAIFFANGISAYAFSGNKLVEIARTGFFELLNRKFNPIIGQGINAKMAGGFNVLNKEYIMSAIQDRPGQENSSTLIYGVQQEALQCQSSYVYDKYLHVGNDLYGMKNGVTYKLGVGNQIDGQNIECYLTGVSDAEIIYEKEFIRIRVNSNSKPSKIFFYNDYQSYVGDNYTNVVDADAVPLSIKDYHGYECYIPRRTLFPYYRQQGRVMIFKIVNETNEEFFVTSTSVQYKELK
jgi:hypothetical protein